MKSLLTLLFIFGASSIFAQNRISGKVVDEKSKPVPGANVYIDGTYDGVNTDENGKFDFTTESTGKQILTVTNLSSETSSTDIIAEKAENLTIKLRDNVNALDAVIITAGTFESGEKARVSVLKPLDIVTTAGSAGNIIAALETLPGTSRVGEDGRLFVRGGEADETQTYVDGIRVAQPYSASAQDTPTRGRFSPFLFNGISFSTGGYSAEYGEALSSVLLLSTEDIPPAEKTDVSVMTVGIGVGHTEKWEKSSISANVAYIDLSPYQKLVPQDVDWNRPYQSLSGESVYRYQFVNGIFKLYAAFDATRLDINQENINSVDKIRFNLQNNNFYLNTSYQGSLGNQWQITTGLGYGYGKNKIGIDLDNVDNAENAAQLKLKLRKSFSNRFKLSFGSDFFSTKFAETFTPNLGTSSKLGYAANILAGYSEAEIYLSKYIGAKIGVRFAHNDLLDETTIAPRISIGYKVAKNSQFALAYGEFSQAPKQEYLKYSKLFDSERASHYILNFQYAKDRKTFRAEAYYKDYRDLVKFDTPSVNYQSQFNNNGFGYAKGLDLFWRDGYSIKNFEYWVSYSYIDTKRDYRNYPVEATPSFVADHSVSLVAKYWIESWKSQVSFTNSFATGRPYNNPNNLKFMDSHTKPYNSASLSWAYLLTQQKILYFSISNILGTKNIYGYEYANNPVNGTFASRPIVPTADRFFFVGFFWTISSDKKDNQLNNL